MKKTFKVIRLVREYEKNITDVYIVDTNISHLDRNNIALLDWGTDKMSRFDDHHIRVGVVVNCDVSFIHMENQYGNFSKCDKGIYTNAKWYKVIASSNPTFNLPLVPQKIVDDYNDDKIDIELDTYDDVAVQPNNEIIPVFKLDHPIWDDKIEMDTINENATLYTNALTTKEHDYNLWLKISNAYRTGANTQTQTMYTEEEVKQMLIYCVSELTAHENNTSVKMKYINEETIKWFNKNKKKL